MLEVIESQTAKFIKNRILDVLKRYKLKLEQIFSITTDNGANMLAAAKQLQQQFVAVQAQFHGMIDDEDTTAEDSFMEALMGELFEQFTITRCSIHTLQLALNDVVRNEDDFIRTITNIVKQSRKVKYNPFFDCHKEKRPPLWSPTRWGGKYKMVRFIGKREQFFTTLGEQYPELGNFVKRTLPKLKLYQNHTKHICPLRIENILLYHNQKLHS